MRMDRERRSHALAPSRTARRQSLATVLKNEPPPRVGDDLDLFTVLRRPELARYPRHPQEPARLVNPTRPRTAMHLHRLYDTVQNARPLSRRSTLNWLRILTPVWPPSMPNGIASSRSTPHRTEAKAPLELEYERLEPTST